MIYSPHRDTILSALTQEPRLTASQIARFIHDGDGYHKTNAMLQRMVKEKQIYKLARPHVTLDYMYALRGKKPLKLSNYNHELSAGHIYAAFKRTAQLEDWVYYPKISAVEPDRLARITGLRQDLYLEVDRNTEPLWKIDGKVKAYQPGEYQVIFVAPDKTRAQSILEVLEGHRRGNQFLVTVQEWIVSDPLGPIYVSPLSSSQRQSLIDFQ